MSTFSRIATGGIALSASLALLSTAAIAATGVVIDPRGDAIGVTDTWFDYGDFDIDLTRIDIDHGTTRLDIKATFNRTVPDSWTLVQAEIDTNGDGWTDYAAKWYRDAEFEEAWVENAAGATTCSSISTAERLGTNGTVTLRVPRSCIGTPRQVAVHVDALWGGHNAYGDELYFSDSAPGTLIDDRTEFSAPVLSSNTGTATSPAPPRASKASTKTRTTVKLNAKKRVATVKVKVTSPNKQAGRVTGKVRLRVTRGKAVVRTVTRKVNKNGVATVKVPKKFLKRKGTYKVVGSYLGSSRHTTSKNAARFRVR